MDLQKLIGSFFILHIGLISDIMGKATRKWTNKFQDNHPRISSSLKELCKQNHDLHRKDKVTDFTGTQRQLPVRRIEIYSNTQGY